MSAYNFKAQFAPLVESGEKTTTIRANGKKRPPRVGELLQLYTGMRTTACRKLRDGECLDVTPVTIVDGLGGMRFHLDGREVEDRELARIAQRDGFTGPQSFLEFFRDEHGLPFHGWLIKWRPL